LRWRLIAYGLRQGEYAEFDGLAISWLDRIRQAGGVRARSFALWRRLLDNLKILRFIAGELHRSLFSVGSHKAHGVARADLNRPHWRFSLGFDNFDCLGRYHSFRAVILTMTISLLLISVIPAKAIENFPTNSSCSSIREIATKACMTDKIKCPINKTTSNNS
jgi:hypothetical protein